MELNNRGQIEPPIYTAPASISLSAHVSAGDAAVSQVQFFNGAAPIGIGSLGAGE